MAEDRQQPVVAIKACPDHRLPMTTIVETGPGISEPDQDLLHATFKGGLGMLIAFRDEVRCRACGCTEDDCYCCVVSTGIPCWWIEKDLCSACAVDPRCPGL